MYVLELLHLVHTHTQPELGADSLFMVSKSDTFGLEIELRQQATKTSQSDAFPKCPCTHMVTCFNDNARPAYIRDETTTVHSEEHSEGE